MRASEALEIAIAEKVVLSPGQFVVVRGLGGGDEVVRGVVVDVFPDLGVVRVEDYLTGTVLEIDVDVARYDLWVQPMDELPKSTLTVYGSMPVGSSMVGAGV